MKKIFSILSIALFVGMISTVCSCSNDVLDEQMEKETSGWHSARLKFNISCDAFDQNGTTRAADESFWTDGDVVYLLLTDKDGNKVQAYVKYDGTKKEWGEVMYEGFKSYLTCATERVAEAYYIEGTNNLTSNSLTISNSKAVYACTSGTYIYPADGDMTVNVMLLPLTGRIRFQGTAYATAKVNGVKTYTSFSRVTGKFTESASGLSSMVSSSSLYTPYLYCKFVDETNPTLTITTDKTYKTVFDPSSSVLKAGKSGYLDLPTAESHRGWMTIVPVTGVTLNKTSLSLDKGKTETLTASVAPEDATDRSVTWTSSNTSVATVDSNGKVTTVNYGTAIITATSVSDTSKKATCSVEVSSDKLFTVSGVTFRMKLVEGGTFSMGSTTGYSNETPVHNVTLTNDYYIGETEVTQALWKAVTGYSPTSSGSSWSSSYGLGNEYPAYYISYEDVQSFITKLNSLTGATFRMPTEAEWEFAAKGGNKSKGYTYSGSNTIGNVAWYTDNGGSKSHEVKTKSANELGIYDMSGNVWEWCSDWYGSYSSSAQTNPTGATSGSNRVDRGGSWSFSAMYCRTATRDCWAPSYRSLSLGVRLALSAK